MQIIPVILAGGMGERLWPLSSANEPKQFALRDAAGRSLFQATLLRVADRQRFAAPLIIANHAHRFLLLDQLRAIGCNDAQIILEPERRNSAAAITLAALHSVAQQPDAVMLVLPCDHQIDAPEHLLAAIAASAQAAQAGSVVTFAVRPTAPENGYGYIAYGAPLQPGAALLRVAGFIEKPDTAQAQRLIDTGQYGWNSGIFLMRAAVMLDELTRFAPEIHAACHGAYQHAVFDHSFLCPDGEWFRRSPSLSFDYAVMEHTACGAVLEVAMGWHDLGSWQALEAAALKDARGNITHGEVALHDVSDSFIHADGIHVTAIGIKEMLVVVKDSHLLIAPKACAAEIKTLAPAYTQQPVTYRPWGQFHCVDSAPGYQVKRLTIHPGEKISLQIHRKRSEHWVVVEGVATVTRGESVFTLAANESVYIAAGEKHRLENRTSQALIVIEVQTGNFLGEDVIERFEDAPPVCTRA
jgi:mannose-1-phosphate guanylyltransferase/mannose-6-phosphate isomerase